MHQQQTAFENIVGKEEIAHNEQFLLFPQCFLLNQKIVSPFVNIFDSISLFASALEEPKIGILCKGLSLCEQVVVSLLLQFLCTYPIFFLTVSVSRVSFHKFLV